MSSVPPYPPHLARSRHGEQSIGFFLGERGYFFVDGPSGAVGHDPSAHGFDGIAYNPQTRHLIIYDNKSWKSTRRVDKATSIDRSSTLPKHLDDMIEQVQSMTDMPNKDEILDLLQQTRRAVRLNTKYPPRVQIAVSNAGSNPVERAIGVSDRLDTQGVTLIDYYEAPRAVRRSISNQELVAFLGVALGALLQALGDLGIEREVNRRLQNELAPAIKDILSQGKGVLTVILLQETEPDTNDMRARMLLGVYVHGGCTQEDAQEDWENTSSYLPGPSKEGWNSVTRYGWIPPLN
jgi:hypothetical protein